MKEVENQFKQLKKSSWQDEHQFQSMPTIENGNMLKRISNAQDSQQGGLKYEKLNEAITEDSLKIFTKDSATCKLTTGAINLAVGYKVEHFLDDENVKALAEYEYALLSGKTVEQSRTEFTLINVADSDVILEWSEENKVARTSQIEQAISVAKTNPVFFIVADGRHIVTIGLLPDLGSGVIQIVYMNSAFGSGSEEYVVSKMTGLIFLSELATMVCQTNHLDASQKLQPQMSQVYLNPTQQLENNCGVMSGFNIASLAKYWKDKAGVNFNFNELENYITKLPYNVLVASEKQEKEKKFEDFVRKIFLAIENLEVGKIPNPIAELNMHSDVVVVVTPLTKESILQTNAGLQKQSKERIQSSTADFSCIKKKLPDISYLEGMKCETNIFNRELTNGLLMLENKKSENLKEEVNNAPATAEAEPRFLIDSSSKYLGDSGLESKLRKDLFQLFEESLSISDKQGAGCAIILKDGKFSRPILKQRDAQGSGLDLLNTWKITNIELVQFPKRDEIIWFYFTYRQLFMGSRGISPELPGMSKWKIESNFVIITGRNGAGKSQLLSYLSEALFHRLNNNVFFMPSDFQYESFDVKSDLPLFDISLRDDNIKHIKKAINNIEKLSEDKTEYPNYLSDAITHIWKGIRGLKSKDIESSFDRYVQEHINELRCNNPVGYLTILFDRWSKQQKGLAPWEEINTLVSKYIKLKIKICEKKDVNTGFLEWKITDLTGKGERDFDQLSSGEKLTFLMMTWLTGPEGNKTKIMLLDEPDKHLDPYLCELFYKVVYDDFVLQQNKQVIMTTHRLDTVRLAPENSLYIIENGVLKRSKSAVMSHLTMGTMTVIKDIKYVMVEAEDDVKFYSVVYKKFLAVGLLSSGQTELIFMPVGAKTVSLTTMQNEVRELRTVVSGQEFSKGCTEKLESAKTKFSAFAKVLESMEKKLKSLEQDIASFIKELPENAEGQKLRKPLGALRKEIGQLRGAEELAGGFNQVKNRTLIKQYDIQCNEIGKIINNPEPLSTGHEPEIIWGLRDKDKGNKSEGNILALQDVCSIENYLCMPLNLFYLIKSTLPCEKIIESFANMLENNPNIITIEQVSGFVVKHLKDKTAEYSSQPSIQKHTSLDTKLYEKHESLKLACGSIIQCPKFLFETRGHNLQREINLLIFGDRDNIKMKARFEVALKEIPAGLLSMSLLSTMKAIIEGISAPVDQFSASSTTKEGGKTKRKEKKKNSISCA